MGALDKLKDTAKKIREAVYGVDVRDDIADGFENVVDAQNEYEQKVNKSVTDKINSDFANFESLTKNELNGYVDNRVEEKIVEVMDDLSDDNLRSEIQQGRNSAVYATNYTSLDARFEADEAKLKSVSTEVTEARNSTANGKIYSSLDSRLEEDETKIKAVYTKVEADEKYVAKVDNTMDVLYTGSLAPLANGYSEANLAKNANNYKYLLVSVMVWVDWTTEKFYYTVPILMNETFPGGHFQEVGGGVASMRLISNGNGIRAYRWSNGRAYQLVRVVGIK